MKQIDLSSFTKESCFEHTSKGNQPKWLIENRWYKADHMGYEALAEVLISRLLKYSNIQEYVRYTPVFIQYQGKERPGCESLNFRSKDEQMVPFERLHRTYEGTSLATTLSRISDIEQRILYTVNFLEQVTGLRNFGPHLTLQLELDAFFLNEDRHTNNLAVLRNEKTKEFRFSPVFDNGLALLSDWNDYPLTSNLYDCISQVHAKPFCSDFGTQVDAAESLFGTQLKFFFTKTDVKHELTDLNALYSEEICARAENVIYEQMRKYQLYFR